ncbi:UDP-N-acetyl-D-mannosamine dehydrogenase [Corynebacterium sp. HMSC074A01]|uniref:UDP-N-acetyl-D-mannosamine dehydrogenase n=1 Tax=Corynebacterium sp. HMSC074A01 TaxID=1715030 RepID=UPI0008A1BAD2|nr:UDP-N-acetyl-D-mannosamine dehydrogenase [Corynebacterium sp. HMSC074A01]OHF36702.1 UDP-N-acetyl-D-mannosamine dehydrogenase [Corynebacterium sp. HMSC074A01]
MKPDIAFVGLGYIGLPTAVVMANSGLNVVGVDVMADKVTSVNAGEVPIVEPGLETALKEALASGRFYATTEMPHASAYIIAVPTPFDEHHAVDMRYIYSAAEAIAPHLEGDELIVLESTSPPMTTEKMAQRIFELRPDLSADHENEHNETTSKVIHFAHCPERILPGHAMEELRTNDRIIGGTTIRGTERAKAIYAQFCEGELLETNARTAELAKLTENSFRDVNIAFANELSMIADDFGINVWELIELANHHPRVNILQPGPGVGGHCIAVDPWFIVASSPEQANLIRTAREVNDSKPDWVLEKVSEAIKRTNATQIAVLGLAFKPDIDDLRESPSLKLAESITTSHPDCQILAAEPNIKALPPQLAKFPNVQLAEADQAIRQAQVVVLLVNHKEFRTLSATSLRGKELVDTKGIWDS